MRLRSLRRPASGVSVWVSVHAASVHAQFDRPGTWPMFVLFRAAGGVHTANRENASPTWDIQAGEAFPCVRA